MTATYNIPLARVDWLYQCLLCLSCLVLRCRYCHRGVRWGVGLGPNGFGYFTRRWGLKLVIDLDITNIVRVLKNSLHSKRFRWGFVRFSLFAARILGWRFPSVHWTAKKRTKLHRNACYAGYEKWVRWESGSLFSTDLWASISRGIPYTPRPPPAKNWRSFPRPSLLGLNSIRFMRRRSSPHTTPWEEDNNQTGIWPTSLPVGEGLQSLYNSLQFCDLRICPLFTIVSPTRSLAVK